MGRHADGATPLHLACKTGCPHNVTILLRYSANPDLVDISGQSSLHIAAARDMSGDIVWRLIKVRASINAQDVTFNETPLHKAIRFQMYDNIRVLVEMGKRNLRVNAKDAQGNTALHKAAESITSIATLTLLMKAGADPKLLNMLGQSPLDKATRAKNLNAISVIRQFEDATAKQEVAKQPSPYSVRRLPGIMIM